MDERSYLEGNRRAWIGMLRRCLSELGMDTAEKHAWIVERQEAIEALRSVCEAFGDNDWAANGYLSDVIEKHLHRHLADDA